MAKLTKTTIIVDEDLLQEMKLYAVRNRKNVSQMIRESIREMMIQKEMEKPSKSLLDLAGTLNLKGKQPPTKDKLYGDTLKQKVGA